MLRPAFATTYTITFGGNIGITEGRTVNKTLRIINTSSSASVTFTLTSRDPDALTVSPTTVNINSWTTDYFATPINHQASANISLTALHDGDTNNKTVPIRITNSRDNTHYDASIVIDDDDNSEARGTIVVTPSGDLDVREGSSGNFQVKLSSAPNGPVTVSFSENTPLLSVPSTTLNFTTSNWNTTQSATVNADQDDNGFDNTAWVTFSAKGGIIAPNISKRVAITDDDNQGFGFNKSTVVVDEPGTGEFGVRLLTRPSSNISVNVTLPFRWAENSYSHRHVTFDTDPNTPGNQRTLHFNRYGRTNAWHHYQTVKIDFAKDDDAYQNYYYFDLTGVGGDYEGVTGLFGVSSRDSDEYGFEIRPAPLIAHEWTGSHRGDRLQVRLTARPVAASTTVRIELLGNGNPMTMGVDRDRKSFDMTFRNGGYQTLLWNQFQSVHIQGPSDDNAVDEMYRIKFSADFGRTLPRSGGGGGVRYREEETKTITVIDDEKPAGTMTLTPAGSFSVDEGGSTTLSVSLSAAPISSADAIVNFSKSNPDLSFSPTTLTFTPSNHSTAQTVSLSAAHDSDFTDETGTITLFTTGGLRTPNITRSVSIADDDSPPGVMEVFPTGTLNLDEGGASRNLAIRLSAEPKADATVSLSKTNSDVSLASTSLTFTPDDYDTWRTVAVSAAQDDDPNNDTDTITLRASGGIDAPTVTRAVFIDDDEPVPGTIQLSPSGRLDMEEGETSTLTVSLSAVPEGNVTVSLSKTNSDITLTPSSLSFTVANYSSEQTVTVSAAEDDDGIDDSDTITLSASGGMTAPNVTKAVAVNDDENPPGTLRLSPSGPMSVDEGGSRSFTVRLSSVPKGDVTVSASSDNPDITISPTSLSFNPPNHWRGQWIKVSAAEDDDAADDAADVLLKTTGAFDAPDVTVPFTVNDDEEAAFDVTTISLNVTEGEEATFGLRLATRPLEDIRISLTSNAVGSPSDSLSIDADPDEAGNQLILGFNSQGQTKAWDDYREISLTAAHDSDKDDESFRVVIAEIDEKYPSKPAVVKITVADDDADKPTGAIEITPAGTLSIDEGESASLSVSLDTDPNANVTISLSSLNEDLSFSPSVLTFTVSNRSTAQPVTVTAGEDSDADDDSATIIFRASGGIIASDATKAVTIVDGDDPPGRPEITPAGTLNITEGESGSLSVSINITPTADVRVSLTSSNPDLSFFPSTLTFTPANHSVAQTVSVSAGQDSDTVNDSATITFQTSGGITAADITKTVAITDDDQPPGTIEITPAGSVNLDEGKSASLSVRLSDVPNADVTVSLSSSNSDLTLHPESLTFTALNYSTARTVLLVAVQDTDAVDDSATITLRASGGISAPAATRTVAIEDDDKPTGTIELTPAGTLSIDEGGSGTLSVSLDTTPSSNVTIALSSSNTDVVPNPDSLIFTVSNHSRAQSVTVNAAQDSDTVNDSATLTLRASGGIVASDIRKSVTVLDDDSQTATPTGTILLSPSGALNIAEGASGSFDISLSKTPNTDVTVSLSKTNPDITLTPTSLTFTSSDHATGQAVTVSAGQDDDAADDSDTLVIEASGGIVAPSVSKAVNIADDESPPPPMGAIEVSPAGTLSIDEGGSGALSVALSATPDANVTISVSSTNSDISLTPTSLTFTPSNYSDAQSVSVSAAQDSDATNDSAAIVFEAAGGITASNASKAVTIVDDDSSTAAPAGSIVLNPSQGLSIVEGGPERSIRISLSVAPDADVTISLSKTSPILMVDKTSLTFTPANHARPQIIVLYALDDDDTVDIVDTITFEAAGGIIAPPASMILTIVDDDPTSPPTLPIPTDSGEMIVSPAAPIDIPEGSRRSLHFRLTKMPPQAIVLGLTSRDGLVSLTPRSLTFTPTNWATGVSTEIFALDDPDTRDDSDSIAIEAVGKITRETAESAMDVRITDDDQPEESAGWQIQSSALAIPPASASDSASIRVRCKQNSPCKLFLDCSTQAGRVLQGYLVIRAWETIPLVSGYLQERFGLDVPWEGRLGCALRSEDSIGSQVWTRSGDRVLVNNSAVIRSAMLDDLYRADIESIPSPDAFDRSNIRIRCISQTDDCSKTAFVCYTDDGRRYEADLGTIPRLSTRHLQADELAGLLGLRWTDLGLSCEARSKGRFTAQILTRTGGGGALVNNSATGE
ncbi:MAG: hypothetical protein ISN28_00990 [Ectothiorhodospiraceae bacterium AqS1]|nr:hypothetical protein [Ectothiorhodospiraceae bacterium AqS1]